MLENLLETAPGKRNSSSIAREKEGKVKIVKDEVISKAVAYKSNEDRNKKSDFDEALEFLQKVCARVSI